MSARSGSFPYMNIADDLGVTYAEVLEIDALRLGARTLGAGRRDRHEALQDGCDRIANRYTSKMAHDLLHAVGQPRAALEEGVRAHYRAKRKAAKQKAAAEGAA